MSDALAAYPVVIEIPVAWGDMDAYAHVNNTVFFRWFESARIAYFDKIAFRDPQMHGGIGPILAATQCRFRRPVLYPSVVQVGASVSEIADDRFTMSYRLENGAGELAAEGTGLIVAYHYAGLRKAKLPAAVRTAIQELEGR